MLIYRIFSILILPFLPIYLFFRILKKKEDKIRFKERFAFSSYKKNLQEIIWIHAVSVGEMNSAMILVEELLKNEKNNILFTTSSLSSSLILQEKIKKSFENRVIHQFLPYDSYFIVKKFLKFWKPKKILFFESEIWINFIVESFKSKIPIFLINARISEKSYKKWFFAKKFKINIFDYFTKIFTQSNIDKNRFCKLTKNEVLYFGNLKIQAKKLEFDEKQAQNLLQKIGNRKIFLGTSTHKNEEEIILRIHKKLKKEFSDLLTILIPRHPNRAPEIIDLMQEINFSQRSKNQEIHDECEVYLVDSFGELGLFYNLSDFAFIGGSLAKIGGHNPFEAISLNCAVLSGENIFNFAEIYDDLQKNQACFLVKNENELFENIRNLLQNPKLSKIYSQNALKLFEQNQQISQKIIENI